MITCDTSFSLWYSCYSQRAVAEALGYATVVQQLADEALEGKHYGIVNLSACNIRSKRGHSSELPTQPTLGTLLNVLKKENGW
jgi:gamma-D-glutamyl-L-lysine dipeptidyl-peptidase